MMHLCRESLKKVGINSERVRLEWVSASEGIRFAEVITDFTAKLKQMGPLGVGEGLDKSALQFKLEALKRLIPYTKLVERERLRVRFDNQEDYKKYFNSDEFNRLFDELITDKVALSQIMLSLRDNPQTAVEVAQALSLNPSEVSRYLKDSTRHGLVRFDEGLKRYAVA
jgi:hypothetical protein